MLRETYPEALYIDLLDTSTLFKLTNQPSKLRSILDSRNKVQLELPVIIDEVQKVPSLLDEVHKAIEEKGAQFLLCGSSARKLKRSQANLLGGRAWRYELHPLVYKEIPNFDLIKALNAGLIPNHYLSDSSYKLSLEGYVADYLQEEIRAEGLSRNLPAFTRFLEAAGFSHGELVNYKNVAKDCAINAKTAKEYFQILEDTLVASLIYPFSRSTISRKDMYHTPKFYFFDSGVASFLRGFSFSKLSEKEVGHIFEGFILHEIIAWRSYTKQRFDIRFWRRSEQLEVDFVLNRGAIAIEAKISSQLRSDDLVGLKTFVQDYKPKKAIVVCNEPYERHVHLTEDSTIHVIPWTLFIERMWEGSLF